MCFSSFGWVWGEWKQGSSDVVCDSTWLFCDTGGGRYQTLDGLAGQTAYLDEVNRLSLCTGFAVNNLIPDSYNLRLINTFGKRVFNLA